jgi:uncharacterized protein YvpB
MNYIFLLLSVTFVRNIFGNIFENRYGKIFKNKYKNFVNIAKKNLNKIKKRIELHNNLFMYHNSFQPYEVFFVNSEENNSINIKDNLLYLKIFNNFKNSFRNNDDYDINNLSMAEYFILPW